MRATRRYTRKVISPTLAEKESSTIKTVPFTEKECSNGTAY